MRASRRVLTLFLVAVILLTVALPVLADDPVETKYVVQPGDNLLKIALKFKVNIFRLIIRNWLFSPNLYSGQELIIPNPPPPPPPPPAPKTQPLPKSVMTDWLAFEKVPDAISPGWGVAFLFSWMLTGGMEGSINREITLARPETSYPPIPEGNPGIRDSAHVLDSTLPRHRERITCWRMAEQAATETGNGGKPPCLCGVRYNEDGTISYAFYYCDLEQPLATGGKWIYNGVLWIINTLPGVDINSSENIEVFDTSSAFADPGKILDQFQPSECPDPLTLIPNP